MAAMAIDRPADGEVGGAQDREVVLFDGKILILRWMDPEIQGRYGTMVYVRCGADARKPAPRAPARPKAAPPPPPR